MTSHVTSLSLSGAAQLEVCLVEKDPVVAMVTLQGNTSLQSQELVYKGVGEIIAMRCRTFQ